MITWRLVIILLCATIICTSSCSDTVVFPDTRYLDSLKGTWDMNGTLCNDADCDWDSLEVVLYLKQLRPMIKGEADVKWYPLDCGGKFSDVWVNGTASADSVHFDFWVMGPAHSHNLAFRLRISKGRLIGRVWRCTSQPRQEYPAVFVRRRDYKTEE